MAIDIAITIERGKVCVKKKIERKREIRKGGYERRGCKKMSTRKGYLLYYYTKGNNL